MDGQNCPEKILILPIPDPDPVLVIMKEELLMPVPRKKFFTFNDKESGMNKIVQKNNNFTCS